MQSFLSYTQESFKLVVELTTVEELRGQGSLIPQLDNQKRPSKDYRSEI